jgi:hypothetical protein
MSIANQAKNAKYIGYQCCQCSKIIEEDERQKIISLGCLQTWCMGCLAKKYPSDKYLWGYIKSNAMDDVILDRNDLLNNQ